MKKIYKVEGMHCASCAMMIEAELEDVGIQAACSYQKQEVAVENDASEQLDQQVRAAVEKAGYRVVSP